MLTMMHARRLARCAIVLAGGDGRRLRPFIRERYGSDLPKQYVNFVGSRSMLEHTFDRIERLIPPERILTVAARSHIRHEEFRRQMRARPSGSLVFQPRNRETGPGIMLPLVHLLRRCPDSTVAVLPSDHFVLHEELFASYLEQAFIAVEKSPSRIVFLGAAPTGPEPEYGYLLPEPNDACSPSLLSVKAFIEKPEVKVAESILSLGALWNTMVMVFRPETLLHLIHEGAPDLHRCFVTISRALGTWREAATIERVYREMPVVNFSRDLLERIDLYSRNQMSVIPMDGVFWSDWGSGERIASTIEMLGRSSRFLTPSIVNCSNDLNASAAIRLEEAV